MSTIAGTFLENREIISDDAPDAPELPREEWERLTDEPSRAYGAFSAYRDLGRNERSIVQAYELVRGDAVADRPNPNRTRARKPPTQWGVWSRTYRWVERAAAWDAHLDRLARREQEVSHTRQIQEYQERQRRMAASAQNISVNVLLRIQRILDALPAVERAPDGAPPLNVDALLPPALTSAMYAAARMGTMAAETEARSLGVDAILAYVADSASE